MTIAQLIPVTKLTIEILVKVAPFLGIKPAVLRDQAEIVETILIGIKESDKYQTLADVLADEELMNNIVNTINSSNVEQEKGKSTTSHLEGEGLFLSYDSTLTCPKCGYISTLKNIKDKRK